MFWRLIGTYGVLVVAAITVLGLVLERRVARHEQQLLESALHTHVRRLERELRGVHGRDTMQRHIEDFIHDEPGLRITLVAADGTVLADTSRDASRLESHAHRPEIMEARDQRFGRNVRRSETTGTDQLYVAMRVDNMDNEIAFVRISQSLDEQPLADLRNLVISTAAMAALAALILTVWFSRQIARPIQQVTLAAERIAAGNYGEKVYAAGQGEIVRLARTFNHMSQRLAQQINRLEEDQAQLRAILSGMVEGVVALDAEQRIAFINDRARQLLEFPTASAVGRKLWDVVRQRALLDLVHRAVASELPQKEEVNWTGLAHRSLTVHAVRLSGQPPRGSVLVIHDTSELRRLERIRREFVANVSHELKTPLTVIQTSVETLLDGGAAEDPKHRRMFLEQLSIQAQRLHYLITDLLSLARIESGEEVFTFQEVPIAELAEQLCERLRNRAELRKQTLSILVAEEMNVWADDEAVFQIMENLIDNALKYTPDNGRIQVRWWPEHDHGCIEVQDNGIGIPATDLPRIFERFYRVDKARSREMGGTGLGLSIVKHLVQSMRGSISAVSRVGTGTTFTVRLPLRPLAQVEGVA